MKLILEVPDKKAPFFLEMLKNFSYVRAKKIPEPKMSAPKARLVDEIREAVEYMKLVKAGKAEGRPIEELLNEL